MQETNISGKREILVQGIACEQPPSPPRRLQGIARGTSLWNARQWKFGEGLGKRQIKDNMAAAVEGTPRRVRALLSSFLHTSDQEEQARYIRIVQRIFKFSFKCKECTKVWSWFLCSIWSYFKHASKWVQIDSLLCKLVYLALIVETFSIYVESISCKGDVLRSLRLSI